MGKSIKRPVSVLLALVLVFQLLPRTFNSDQIFQSHWQSSKVVQSATLDNHRLLFVSKEIYIGLFQRISTRVISFTTSLVSTAGVYLVGFFLVEEFLDYRTIIRQSISHYFNGGKYK